MISAMNLVLEELASSVPDARETVRIVIRLVAALLAGAIIGLQRERSGKAAGLRTHMLISMGTTLFVIACTESGMAQGEPLAFGVLDVSELAGAPGVTSSFSRRGATE